LPSIGSLVFDGAARLSRGPHRERARQDAETLLLHILGRNKAWLMTHPDDEIPASEAGLYAESLERRSQGEPIQYIAGEAEFYGLPFQVNRDVLIPRPETEHLVEKALELAARFPEPRIVDVGAGSGAIAVTLAHKLPRAAVTTTDISAPALDVARRNAARNGVADRIRFLSGDLLAPVAEEQFEIVVSNPPYVPNADCATLSVEVRDFEPAQALFAGNDGLDIYLRLIPAVFAVLVRGGFIALEIGYGQSPAIAALLAAAGFRQIEFVPDLQGIPRVAFAQRP
jgi:release factor glutamine methyltransferase